MTAHCRVTKFFAIARGNDGMIVDFIWHDHDRLLREHHERGDRVLGEYDTREQAQAAINLVLRSKLGRTGATS
jgi:hypothetical protein